MTGQAQPTTKLRWREAGEGAALLLLHAFPVDSRLFEGQLDAARAGRLKAHVICPDLPGFGGSPIDGRAEALSVEELAEQIASLIEGLQLGPAVVGGVAIGGYIAIELAARHPELVRGLVLMGNKPAADLPAMAPKREAVARLALEQGSAAAAAELADQPLAPGAGADLRERVAAMITAADPAGIAALVRGLARRPDPAPQLTGLNMPALVFAGTRDPFSKPEDVQRLAEMLPQSTYVELPGVGHMAPIEAPAAVNAALAMFLEELA